ncbi:MAG: tRNA 2-thiouridine(34) synthase MnmA [Calditrichales bacterium]|nr:MAG: tRNA 2-thiouridine(34) synthase MnmA [Calditrichales bacterium]
MSEEKKTVVVAMSGGVDSSVAAMLLHEQGFRVIGITMKLWDFETVGGNINMESGCCSLDSFNDARKICVAMDVPHYILNFSREFHHDVVDNFIDEYLAGRTPNPCVQCNTKIKWKTLVDKAVELGADYIATGHYARVSHNSKTGRYELIKAVDSNKDQSYALWGITQASLAKTLFPLGELTKPQVRELARKYNLPTAEKKESQEICFIPDNNYHRLLKSVRPELEQQVTNGKMVDTSGNLIGHHKGYPFYTIGQRKGLGGGFSEPHYVVDINAGQNLVTIGNKEALLCREFEVNKINLITVGEVTAPTPAKIKIRYNDDGHAGMIYPADDDKLRIRFDKPQKSVTPGQSAVFFTDDMVMGGGIILTRIEESGSGE